MKQHDYPAIVILGPTASGKSGLAYDLTGRFEGEIVSCDALQVYCGMDIGTAKPTAAEQARTRHHMLDLREPGADFSAGDYQRLGRAALDQVRSRHKLPFVVGGTGFYLRALIDGLFDGPGRSEELRARLRGVIERKGAEYLHRRLARIDPATAARIQPADAARTLRAYEIYLLTNKTMDWWRGQARDSLEGYRWLKLGLSWQRETLYARIDARVEHMFRSGFVEEVRGLIERHPRQCHAFKAIGYRQIVDHLDGKTSLEEAVRATQQATRNYAKRQMTWFRADAEIVWLDCEAGTEAVAGTASRIIEDFLG